MIAIAVDYFIRDRNIFLEKNLCEKKNAWIFFKKFLYTIHVKKKSKYIPFYVNGGLVVCGVLRFSCCGLTIIFCHQILCDIILIKGYPIGLQRTNTNNLCCYLFCMIFFKAMFPLIQMLTVLRKNNFYLFVYLN